MKRSHFNMNFVVLNFVTIFYIVVPEDDPGWTIL
jgi:hypothetical protein